MDLPVLLKLQRRVNELEQEKQSLWQKLDTREEAQQEKAKVCAQTPVTFPIDQTNIYQTDQIHLYQLVITSVSLIFLVVRLIYIMGICFLKGGGGAENCWQSRTGFGNTEGMAWVHIMDLDPSNICSNIPKKELFIKSHPVTVPENT